MASTTQNLCRACNEPYTEVEMVQCDCCAEWTHYQCAGVDDSVAKEDWTCSRCLQKAGPAQVEKFLKVFAEAQLREEKLLKQCEEMAIELSALRLEVAKRRSSASASSSHPTTPTQNELMKEDVVTEKQLPVSAATITRSGSGSSEFGEVAALMKLSYVKDLPSFHGTLKDWPYFLSVYNRTTAAASIDDDTNVGRLDKALTGEARELVLDQLTLGRRPSEIIDILQRRYGNKDALLRHLASNLIEFPRIESTKDPSLRRFAVAIKTYVAQLRTMKLQEELNSSLLVAHLHDKLSNLPAMFQKWTRMKRESSDPVVEVFANFLMDQWEHLPHALTWDDEAKPLDRGRHAKSLEGLSATWEPGEDIE
jgi:hypothetical protein